jgi:hypothetical protein
MAGDPHPVEQIVGLQGPDDHNDVSKADFVAFVKSSTALVMPDADAVLNTNLAGQLLLTLLSNGRTYQLDTLDTTSVPSDALLRDANGLAFAILPIEGIDGADSVVTGTSATNLAIATGSKIFATQAGVGWALGQRLRAASDDATKVMEGEVTAYSGTSLTVDVDYTAGSGSHADWNLSVAGERGGQGDPGADGDDGAPGLSFDPDAVVDTFADRDAYDAEAQFFAVLVIADESTDGTPHIYWKLSAANADWSAGAEWGGGGSGGDSSTSISTLLVAASL